MPEFSTTSSPRGATNPISMWWSNGSTLTSSAVLMKLGVNHPSPLTICVESSTLVPFFFMSLTMRQHPGPPDPPSCGSTSAMRSSNAPDTSAPLPLREHPVTPSRETSILVLSAPRSSSASTTRLTPHAHAMRPPAECVDPYRS